jgi:predicted RNase H-like nuclease (RuvC/YqgF family)
MIAAYFGYRGTRKTKAADQLDSVTAAKVVNEMLTAELTRRDRRIDELEAELEEERELRRKLQRRVDALEAGR